MYPQTDPVPNPSECARYPKTGASTVPDLADLGFLGPVDDDPTCGLGDAGSELIGQDDP